MRLDLAPEELTILAKALAPVLAKELRPLLQAKATGQGGDIIFTVETLSEYLHVPKSKIYNLSHLKEIPHVKVGKGLKFRKADIDSWLQSSYTPAVSGISEHFRRRVAICQK